jgi:Cu+-exporting ATPase
VKDAAALEALARVDTLVVDKTGTLTEGRPSLVSVLDLAGRDDSEALRLAASLERGSEHPLAAAVVRAAKARGLALTMPSSVVAHPGQGLSGAVQSQALVLGSRRLLVEQGIDPRPFDEPAKAEQSQGRTVLLLAVDGRARALLSVTDRVKTSAPEAIRALHDEGLRLVMLTGDHRAAAEAVARSLGIDQVEAELLPEHKAQVVRELQAAGRTVAMAGDGINDAPALSAAAVGIAIGTGTDVAIESSDLTLVQGDLRGIVRARRLALATVANIRQNLFWAFFYNALGIPIAAGVLFPWLGWLLSPMVAAAAMSLSSVSVISNALRLRSVQLY